MLTQSTMERFRAFSTISRSSSIASALPAPVPAHAFVRSSRDILSSSRLPYCQPHPRSKRAMKVGLRCQNLSAAAAGPKDLDPFLAASSRLQDLLAGVGDGDAELVDSLVSDEAPESRLQMQVVLSGAMTAAAVTVSMICGNDPWGGASCSFHSLLAAAIGFTAATPLIMFRAWSWTRQAAEWCPAFEDMHTGQINLQAPWYRGAAPWHVATMLILEVLPITLLLLPTAQGALIASVSLYTTALQSLGAPGPASLETLQFSCLALTAAVSAMTKGLELGISDSEYEVVQAAVDNSDRYYRLMAMDMTGCFGSAQRAALAFRSVAEAWMDARNDASCAAMSMCAVDVFALGALWYWTGDLAAPAAAALSINAVDAIHIYKAVARRDARVSMASAGPSSSPSSSAVSSSSNQSSSSSSSSSGPNKAP